MKASVGSKMIGVGNSACYEGFRRETQQTSKISGVGKSASDEGFRREQNVRRREICL